MDVKMDVLYYDKKNKIGMVTSSNEGMKHTLGIE